MDGFQSQSKEGFYTGVSQVWKCCFDRGESVTQPNSFKIKGILSYQVILPHSVDQGSNGWGVRSRHRQEEQMEMMIMLAWALWKDRIVELNSHVLRRSWLRVLSVIKAISKFYLFRLLVGKVSLYDYVFNWVGCERRGEARLQGEGTELDFQDWDWSMESDHPLVHSDILQWLSHHFAQRKGRKKGEKLH